MILNNEETRQTRKHIVLKSYYKCNTVIYVDIYNQTYNRKQINNWKNDIGTPFFQQGPIDKKFSGLTLFKQNKFPIINTYMFIKVIMVVKKFLEKLFDFLVWKLLIL